MKTIDEIIDSYFEGEATLEEEKQLRAFFLQPNVPLRYASYKPMFNYFSEEIAQKEVEVTPIATKKRRLPIYLQLATIAASLVLILTIGLTFFEKNDTTKSIAYIDGKKISNMEMINAEALQSLENVSDMGADNMDLQISVLDSFIE